MSNILEETADNRQELYEPCERIDRLGKAGRKNLYG